MNTRDTYDTIREYVNQNRLGTVLVLGIGMVAFFVCERAKQPRHGNPSSGAVVTVHIPGGTFASDDIKELVLAVQLNRQHEYEAVAGLMQTGRIIVVENGVRGRVHAAQVQGCVTVELFDGPHAGRLVWIASKALSRTTVSGPTPGRQAGFGGIPGLPGNPYRG